MAYLPTALFAALGPLFPIRQAHYAQVFPLKPAPFCTLFAGLSSTNKSFISLFLFSHSRSVLSSTPSFLLPQTLWQIWHGTYGRYGRRRALLVPSVIPCSLFPLICRIHSSIFSDWRRPASSKFLDTAVPRFPLRNLRSLVTLAVCSLVFAATDTAFC